MANLFFNDDFIFDSHCHLNDAAFDEDREGAVRRAVEAGVPVVVDIAVNVPTAEAAIENARTFPGTVFATVGIDPDVLIPGSDLYEAEIDIEQEAAILKRLVLQNQQFVVGIGETGMENYWLPKSLDKGEISLNEYNRIQQIQEQLFTLHLGLAEELNLPLSIHSRGAEQRCLEIIKSFPKARGVFHSFTGNYDLAKQVLDAGWALGVNGIVTFKSAHDLRAMYRQVLGQVSAEWTPSDFYTRGVYLETDAPYLAPEGKRGTRNEPAYIADILTYMVTNLNTAV